MIVKKMLMNEQLKKSYVKLFNNIFEDIDAKQGMYQNPSILYAIFDEDNMIGFASGYLHNEKVFYMQYAGMIKQFRGYKTLIAFRETLKEINKEYPIITCMIKNNNIPAIKLAINQGFIINGIKQDKQKNLYIEMLREDVWQI